MSKQVCKNHESYTFSGKEMSPLGLGYTAEAEEVGTVMEGRDKTMWMVGIKNGVRVWNRIPTQVAATVVPSLEKESPPLAAKKSNSKKPSVEPVDEAETSKAAEERVPEITPVEQETSNASEAPKPKAKAPAKKKAAPKEETEVPEAAPKPKTKAPAKKKAVAVPEVVEAAAPAQETEAAEAPKKKKAAPKKPAAAQAEEAPKKAPTSFNLYMSFRMDQMKKADPTMDNKSRFVTATAEWKNLSTDDKEKILAEAKEWYANKQ